MDGICEGSEEKRCKGKKWERERDQLSLRVANQWDAGSLCR